MNIKLRLPGWVGDMDIVEQSNYDDFRYFLGPGRQDILYLTPILLKV